MSAKEYDVIVIGAGPTGENVADRAVKGGLQAVIVEADLVGGECSYWACIPSKALLRPLQALTAAQSVAGAREAITGSLDAAQIFARRDSFTGHWNDKGQSDWLRNAKIDLVRGHARLSGERKVIVTEKNGSTLELIARHAVAVCTGSRAAIPATPGLAEARPWTSREATSAREAPNRLAIIGGVWSHARWRQLGRVSGLSRSRSSSADRGSFQTLNRLRALSCRAPLSDGA